MTIPVKYRKFCLLKQPVASNDLRVSPCHYKIIPRAMQIIIKNKQIERSPTMMSRPTQGGSSIVRLPTVAINAITY